MRMLILAFYILFGALLAWFAATNWDMVSLRLGAGYELQIRLPVLMILCFLAGALPFGVLRNLSRWQFGRKVRKLGQALADAQATPTAPSPFEGSDTPRL